MMLRCSEVTRLYASDEVDRAAFVTRFAARMHVMMCRYCRRYVRELVAIGRASSDMGADYRTDPARTEAIIERVLNERALSPKDSAR